MAIELLFRLVDGHKGDGRRAGNIVCVKQVPHAGWGSMERPPTYGLITITDKDVTSPEIASLSRRRILVRQLSQRVRDQIDMGRSEPMSWKEFKNRTASKERQ